jgi:hypothetical protein
MFKYSYRAFVHRKKVELDSSVIQSGDTGMQAMRTTDGAMPIAAQSVIGYACPIMTRLVAVMCLSPSASVWPAAQNVAGFGTKARAAAGPTRHAERKAPRSLRSDKVENGSAQSDKQSHEQGVLQNRKRPTGCFGHRCHVVDLPRGDCGECDDHHAGIFCPFFAQDSAPAVLCDISLFIAQIPIPVSKNS